MRPERLELSGFTAFRRPTVIDFDGADMFVLVGPTGSGKSSVIDAITFALYGSVPRYDDVRLVAPVVSQGKVEAKVRFDFAVGAEQYSATRVVRRTRSGATTKEARLERRDGTGGCDVLAGTADELTAGVRDLLGLGFDEFCKCVVLPQGEFARFLHDKPNKRQDVLVGLLDLGVYGEMGVLARKQASQRETEVEFADKRLAQLAGSTDEELAVLEHRIERLADLLLLLDRTEPREAELTARGETVRQEARRAREDIEVLGTLCRPEGIDLLGERQPALRAQLDLAEEASAQAETEEATIRESLASLPERSAIEHVLQLWAGLDDVTTRLAKLREEQATSAQTAEAATAEFEAADVVGDICPVCRQTVTELPGEAEPEDLTSTRQERENAAGRRAAAERSLQVARDAATRARIELESVERRRDELIGELEGQPDRQSAKAILELRQSTEQSLREASARVAEARGRVGDLKSELGQLDGHLSAAWDDLQKLRDSVAHLRPPSLERDDIEAAYRSLLGWAATAAEEAEARLQAASEEETRVEGELDSIRRDVGKASKHAGLEPGKRTRDSRDACVRAQAEAGAARDRIESEMAEAARLVDERNVADEARAVATELGRLLGARQFEKWVVDEAMERLVGGATQILQRLTSGQYSLTLNTKAGSFSVVDHRNADEQRSARTLSGGETFLASLSLALALAEEIRALAAGGRARLESIFLDEGFGTLDSETLDVVAAAMEELGAEGTVVGLVTHVRELADRVPVRFEVRPEPEGSTVERVDA
ncbi:MAG: SMC family ATPase [Actinobacteria bacterium ATB1]|nr:SMC family ATPase [Actinobacteria bacterium ATB1]